MQVIVLTSSFAAKTRADQADNLVQVGVVVDALAGLGFEVSIISVTLDMESLYRQMNMLKPGLVFNLVEEIQSKGSFVHFPLAVLESMHMAYTGNSHSAMIMTSCKLLAKKTMLAHSIPTPQWLTLNDLVLKRTLNGGAIIKSVWEHGSLGMGKANLVKEFARKTVEQKIRKLNKKHSGSWFVEKYIPGREINVSILETLQGPMVLPVSEIVFTSWPEDIWEILDYQAKWAPGSKTARASQRRFLSFDHDAELMKAAKDMALRCWEVFEMSGYARVDLRADQDSLFVLEVNANPCLSPDSGFMASADKAGMSGDQVIEAIVQSGLSRKKS